jgi:hypothetical protein
MEEQVFYFIFFVQVSFYLFYFAIASFVVKCEKSAGRVLFCCLCAKCVLFLTRICAV